MRYQLPEDETLYRELLANERTLLAWIRSGTGAISVGILLGFTGQFLSILFGSQLGIKFKQEEFVFFGVAMVAFGVFLEIIATAQFIRYQVFIRKGIFTSSLLVYLLVALGMLILGVAYVIYAVTT